MARFFSSELDVHKGRRDQTPGLLPTVRFLENGAQLPPDVFSGRLSQLLLTQEPVKSEGESRSGHVVDLH